MPGYVSVKNFERFQHYKDRSPLWIKLYNSLLDDYEFAALPDASKGHLLAIWLLASRYQNRIPADPVWIQRRINANSPVELQTLVRLGFLVADEEFSDASNLLAEPYKPAIPEKRRVETEREKEPPIVPQGGRARKLLSGEALKAFESWYPIYPRHVGRGAAERAFLKALPLASVETLIAGARAYAEECAGKEAQYVAHPSTWLNGKRWLDAPHGGMNGSTISEPRRPREPPPPLEGKPMESDDAH